jgi:ABC-type dipeptide/oligopeptide/nickel transport system permease component
MRMLTYVLRRLLLVVPTVIGVLTITFLLFSALPIQYQLAAHFGNPPRNHPCAFEGSCPCYVDNKGSVTSTDTCTCYGSNVSINENATCIDSLYTTYVDKLGLNQPLPVQWVQFLYRAFTLQWGYVENDSHLASDEWEFIKNVSVTTVIGWLLPYTLELAALSLVIILLIAIPVGNLAAVNRNRPIDQISRVISFSGFALPAFLLGSLAIIGVSLVFLPVTGLTVHAPWCKTGESLYYELTGSWPTAGHPGPDCFSNIGGTNIQQAQNGYYPLWLTGGYASHPTGFPTVDAIIHHQYWLSVDTVLRMILPALVIAFGSIAGILRFVRNSMLEVMNLDYIRTARAKGVPEKVVTKLHAGKNSFNVTLTVLGLTFAFFLGGFPIIENVFNLYGVGNLLALSVVSPQSFAIIFGTTILFTFIVIAANIIVDVLYAYLDPRVRLG